ncbi:DUF5722 domain-containing protein [Agromyces sp. NPDC058126]|uniref:DUF5722 domain-containing protein n=1 Tax=Agromyces sp. NPDC058126 TaxID=3346350 RepID=UPI0036DF26CC
MTWHEQVSPRSSARRRLPGRWRLIAVAVAAAIMGSVLTPLAAAAAETPHWTFGTAGDLQGWSAGTSTATVAATEAGLEVQITGGDPWVMSGKFALDATTANTVHITAQNETENTGGKIYWSTVAQPTFAEERSATFDMRESETAPGEYVVDLRGVPVWTGTIERLRIDPGENASDMGRVVITDVGFSFNSEPLPEPEPDPADREPVEHIGSVEPVSATADEIRVTGTAPAATSATTLTLYELDGWEYEPDFADGIELGTVDGGGSFDFRVSRMDGERDRISSKFLVVADAGGTPSFIDSARYVTVRDFPSDNDFAFPAPATKKGLQVQLTDDADELGVGHAAINIALDRTIQTTAADDAIEFEYDGETYYFDRAYMAEMDQTIKPLSDNGMVVNAILIAYDDKGSNPGAADLIIHPDAARRASGAVVYAFNTVDENSRYFRATMAFLADRYSREDQAHGRVVGWIVGNEVNSGWVWQNMGERSLNRFVDDYERAVRWVDTAVRNEYAGGRTYISLDHLWTMALSTTAPKRYYKGRDVLDRMNAVADEGGQFGWDIAYHPYPENLFNPATWNDQTALDSIDSPRITFKNLHILGQYLQRDELMYQGAQRRIILSEQGFHAPGNDAVNADLQAAGYAYAYYRAVTTPGIDSFILHRHVDHKQEGGLRLGLWTWDDARPEPSSPDKMRRIYDVFKYIDTPESRAHTEFALPIIGVDSWEELFPELDIEGQGVRPLPVPSPVELREETVDPEIAIGADQWIAGENVASVAEAAEAVTATFDTLDKQWRGVTFQSSDPVDASDSGFLQVRLNVPGTDPAAQRVAKIKAYSGVEVAEGVVALDGADSILTLDLRGWDARSRIDRVKVWVRGESNADWEGEFSASDAGFTNTPGEPGAANLAISATAEEVAEGEKVTFTVANRGGTSVSGALSALDSGSVTLTEGELPLGDLASMATTTTEGTIAGVADGDVVDLEFDGREYAVTVGVAEPGPETGVPDGTRLLYDFEEDVQGWKAGSNTAAVSAASSSANQPGTPRLGGSMLAVVTNGVAADKWRSAYVDLVEPIPASEGDAILVSLNAYGGLGTAHEARISLTTTSGEYEHVETVKPDSWNDLRMPLDGVEGDLTRLTVSFRATGSSTPWAPQFQVDRVAMELAEDTTPPVITGMPEGIVNADDGLELEILAEDAESGIGSLSVTLDGQPIEPKGFVDLSGLSGEHVIAATAVNGAGLSAEASSTLLVVPSDGATSAPGMGSLANTSGWKTGQHDGTYDIRFHLWWGTPGSVLRLFENGAVVETRVLTAVPGATSQHVSIPFAGKPDGTYEYRAQLINSRGATFSTTTTVKVTSATPGVPVVSHDNRDGDGDFTVTANMWWGTNADAYTFTLDGQLIGEGSLVPASPAAQKASVHVTGVAPGEHTLVATFRNPSGATESKPVEVTVDE